MQHQDSIDQLWRDRSRDWKRTWLWGAFAGLLLLSCILSNPNFDSVFSERRITNLRRFLSEVIPYPIRQGGSVSDTCEWFFAILWEKGFESILVTLAVSILAISIAGVTSFCLSFFSARSLCSRSDRRFFLTRAAGALLRAWFMIVRAIPEYVWAFLAIALLGPGAAPGILALAIHNHGVLGRLGTDLLEDLPAKEAMALRRIGATEAQIAVSTITPLVSGKFLALVLYRWETCLREATVLGLLGISSIGFWVQDSRARNRYDEMIVFIIFVLMIVLVGELVSIVTRSIIRKRYSERIAYREKFTGEISAS